MNLNMKQRKIVLTVMILITVVLLLLANLLHGHLARLIAWILMIASLAMFVLVWAKLWRCPKCGGHLGRMGDGSDRCPHCGEKLE